MARILILANSGIGLYKFRKELIEELVKDNEVFISVPNGEFIDNLTELGCNFIETNISRRGTNPITDFKLMMKYKRVLDSIRPNVVLTYTIKPNIYGGIICRLLKTPYISNITGLGTAVENDGILQYITLFLYKFALKKASCVFFQNSENANFINSKNIISSAQRLIPGSGVNLKQYNVLDYPDDDTTNFLFISRVMREKGIDQYIDAALYIKNRNPKINFHVLGFCEDEYEDKLRNLHENGVIKYHGMQSDIMKYLLDSHCTIHPTYYPEGMSNVLLESAACGRPIITTDRSGCKEIVDDGINGYVVNQKDSQDLIEKIEKFLMLSRENKIQMGLAGREKVEKYFDRQIVIKAYIEEVKKII